MLGGNYAYNNSKTSNLQVAPPTVHEVSPYSVSDDGSWRSAAIERLSLILASSNYYEDDEVFLTELTRKPVNVIIVGKPGAGKTTVARLIAKKMNLIRIDPESLIEYYRFHDVIHHLKVDDVLASGGSISDRNIAQLLEVRVAELDVLHRGYIIDGFPMMTSEEFSVEEQMDVLHNLPLPPQYIINLQMQDEDLYSRRTGQKIDPKTFIVYTREHYMKFNAALGAYARNQRIIGFDEQEEDESNKDFPPLMPEVIFRLISRPEDSPYRVNYELEQCSSKMASLQGYLEQFEASNILELDATLIPSALRRTTMVYFESCGERPACIPEQIISKLEPYLNMYASAEGEFLGEDDDSEAPCSEDELEIPWESVIRACKMHSQVDYTFKWKLTRWHNLCPVALKYGRSIVGKPKLVTSFLDNIFFLSSPEALEQFKFNPRPYLLPKMPTSPIKFFVLGHPLAGKSTFAKELAFITKSSVVDMNHEMENRYSTVVHDHLYKKRLKYTLEAKLLVDRDARKAWRREERARRFAMRKWIEDYIRSLTEAEINAALEADRPRRNAERNEMRQISELHAVRFPLHPDSGVCQLDESKIARMRKKVWEHQMILEVALDLFHDHTLHYKSIKKKKPKKRAIRQFEEIGEDGEFGSNMNVYGEDESEPGEGEELGEGDAESIMKFSKKRHRHCREIKPVENEELEEKEEEYPDSSDLDPDDLEVDESYRMRYPMIPSELVDIVPMPTPVPDHHPIVEEIVCRRLEEDEKYVETLPTELYIEVLRRACAEAESKYHLHNAHGPLSGGWVVDNLMIDIEKWRGILRTPDVCPDQIFVLLDHSDNHKEIFRRLKKIFKAKNMVQGSRMQELLDQLEQLGESMYDVLNPEDDADLFTHVLRKSSSQKLHDSLPIDDLNLPVEASTTTLMQITLDANRERTPDPHDVDELELLLTEHERLQKLIEAYREQNPDAPDDEELTLLIEQHEQFILNHVKSNMSLGSNLEQKDLSVSEFKYFYPEILVRIGKPRPTSAEMIEQIKDDVWIITEYMRPNKNIKLPGEEEGEDFNAMRSNASQAGEDGDDQSNEISTPAELKSSTDLLAIACPEDMAVDLRVQCIQDYHAQKMQSPKRRFFSQIRLFDEFWNMAVPVCNEQRVKFWEVGLISERNARLIGLNYWDKLEARFAFRARRVPDAELMGEGE